MEDMKVEPNRVKRSTGQTTSSAQPSATYLSVGMYKEV